MISGPNRFRYHRPFDLAVAVAGLIVASPILAISWLAAGRAAKGSGIFRQTRIGQHGQPFEIVKFRTMRADSAGTTVTAAGDHRITRVGGLLRKSKVDEIPQLLNVLKGEMSLIGPRPDVAGFADELEGKDREVLSIRPGVTGPASVLFADEEQILASVEDPVTFNADVLFPSKTAINRAWIEHASLIDDLRILVWTVKRPNLDDLRAMINRWEPGLSLDPIEGELQHD